VLASVGGGGGYRRGSRETNKKPLILGLRATVGGVGT